ncbi:MAG TPA: DUF4384 domain-containing protein [bacterium]|nr:DUF4384 domain-containing protein [bacterium]
MVIAVFMLWIEQCNAGIPSVIVLPVESSSREPATDITRVLETSLSSSGKLLLTGSGQASLLMEGLEERIDDDDSYGRYRKFLAALDTDILITGRAEQEGSGDKYHVHLEVVSGRMEGGVGLETDFSGGRERIMYMVRNFADDIHVALTGEPLDFNCEKHRGSPLCDTGFLKISDPAGVILNNGNDFRLRVWPNRSPGAGKTPVYYSGENMELRLISEKDCYVYLFSVDSDGWVSALRSENSAWPVRIHAEKVYRIPDNEFPFTMRVFGEPGMESIIALAVTEELKSDSNALVTKGDTGIVKELSAFSGNLADLIKWNRLRKGSCSARRVMYRVGRRPAGKIPGFAEMKAAGVEINNIDSGLGFVLMNGNGFSHEEYGRSMQIYSNADGSERMALIRYPGEKTFRFMEMHISAETGDEMLFYGTNPYTAEAYRLETTRIKTDTNITSRLDSEKFVTEKGIGIGMTMRDVETIHGKPGYVLRQDNKTIWIYYLVDGEDDFLKANGMPVYEGVYVFESGSLVSFRFGFPMQ